MKDLGIDFYKLSSDQQYFLCTKIEDCIVDKQISSALISFGFHYIGELIPFNIDFFKNIEGLEDKYVHISHLMNSNLLKLGIQLNGWSAQIANEENKKRKLIKENELIIPALYEILVNEGLSTTELIQKLRERLKPNHRDITKLNNRSDDYFSQKVRNLISHKTLINKQFVIPYGGRWVITSNGYNHLKRNIIYNSLDFDLNEISHFKELHKPKKDT